MFEKIFTNNKELAITSIGLSLSNGLNYLIPLFVYPLIIYYTNIRFFGTFAIILSINQIYTSFSDFGYSILGVEKIARLSKLNRLKFLLNSIIVKSILSIGLLIPGILLFVYLQLPLIYILFLIQNIFLNLNISYYYIATKQTFFISKINLISKTSLFIIILVWGEIYYLNEVSLITAYFFSNLLFLYNQTKFLFNAKSFLILRLIYKRGIEFKEALNMYYSTLWIAIYRNASTIFLKGYGLSDKEIGIFFIIDKIIKAVQSTFNPVLTAFIPFLNKESHNTFLFRQYEKKYYVLFVSITLLVNVTFYLAQEIFEISFLKDIDYTYFGIMSCIILFGGGGYFYGLVGLPYFGDQKVMSYIFFIGAGLGLGMLIIFINFWGVLGAAIAFCSAELIIMLLSKYRLENKIKYLTSK